MSWAKLDDRFHENRKVRGLWRKQPAALGLHVLALTYCAGHETDGEVDLEFVEDKVPTAATRRKLTGALVDAGMWVPDGDHWRVHDYLDYHPSRATLDEKREADRERKARGGRNGKPTASARKPNGFRTDSARSPDGFQSASKSPVPSRPVLTPAAPKGAASPTDVVELEEWLQHHQQITNHEPPKTGSRGRAALAESFHARRGEGYTLDDLKLATVGAHQDPYRRDNGYDTAESILRPTKVAGLVAKGRLRTKSQTSQRSVDLVAAVNRAHGNHP